MVRVRLFLRASAEAAYHKTTAERRLPRGALSARSLISWRISRRGASGRSFGVNARTIAHGIVHDHRAKPRAASRPWELLLVGKSRGLVGVSGPSVGLAARLAAMEGCELQAWAPSPAQSAGNST
jgi:hypothetical protein